MVVESKRRKTTNDTRERLITAAAGLFAERGYEQATLAAIGGAVGVTAPAMYRHFTSKDELLLAVLVTKLEEALAESEAALQERDPVARLRAVVGVQLDLRLRLRAGDAGPATFSIGHLAALLPPESRVHVTDLVRRNIRTLSRVLREGRDRRVFKELDPSVTAFAIMGMLDAVLWLRPRGRLRRPQLKEHFQRLAVEMVVPC